LIFVEKEVLNAIISAISGLTGALLGLIPHLLGNKSNKQDIRLKQIQFDKEGFSRACEEWKNAKKVQDRIAALGALRQCGDYTVIMDNRETLVQMLQSFIREGFKSSKRTREGLYRPTDDVIYACGIVSHFSSESCRAPLHKLQAEDFDLAGMNLSYFDLTGSCFTDKTSFLGTYLYGARLQQVTGLSLSQLITANTDTNTKLDNDLAEKLYFASQRPSEYI